MMRLVVAIPAFNEELALPKVLKKIRECISSIKESFILVVDDGSSDNTVDVAKECGADIIASHEINLGVAYAYKTAIDVAVGLGADVICTIDADGQFNPNQIHSLIKPIINQQADVVIGSRFLDKKINKNIPISNLIGNKIMARIVSMIIRKRVTDTESGFRAIARNAASRLQLLGKVSFSNDMILDLSKKKQKMIEVPVHVKYFEERSSRAISGFVKYGLRTLFVIFLKIFNQQVDLKKLHDYYPRRNVIMCPRLRSMKKDGISKILASYNKLVYQRNNSDEYSDTELADIMS